MATPDREVRHIQDTSDLKTCAHCGQQKPAQDYYRNSKDSEDRHSWCKACDDERNRRYRAEHAQELTQKQKARRDRQAAQDETYYVRHNLRCFYRLTLEEYERKLVAQSGGCAVCGEPPGARRLAVDHDRRCCPGNRSCGRCVRGLLCLGCNNGTGLKDDPVLLLARADYVEQWAAWHEGLLFG